ncbi:hypothetical protein IWW40_001507 [Coemansia sp. RSA 1250]|nr:hypothetical protein IWW40_001507 [Coemansia sp. RSA 1250]
MAGAFPESVDSISKETEKGSSRNRNAKAKRKKAAKNKQTPSPESAKPALPQTADPEPGAPKSDSPTDDASQAEPKTTSEPQPKKDEWQAVGATGAKPPKKQSSPIPIHSTKWSAVANDVDLSEDETKQPSQHRVMRIKAPSQPPAPPAPPRRENKGPQPLTKRQRQSRKKAERRREENAHAAALQEQRLRAHQRELFDIRSREQWKRERLQEARGPPKGAPPNRSKNVPHLTDGKLIWD